MPSLKYSTPPPPTALLRMRGGTYMLTHVHPFVLPTVNRPDKLNICTVLYCPPFCSVVLFMPPPHNRYFVSVLLLFFLIFPIYYARVRLLVFFESQVLIGPYSHSLRTSCVSIL
jgi:hypothetical protein